MKLGFMKGSLFCFVWSYIYFIFFFDIILMCKYKMKCEIVKHSVGGSNTHYLVCQPPLKKKKKKRAL